MVWTTVSGTERELWDYVTRMKSPDYVERVYEQFNGSPPKRRKTEQVNAAFAQGRICFEKAKLADLGANLAALPMPQVTRFGTGVHQESESRGRFSQVCT